MRKIYNRLSLCTKVILLFATLVFVVVGVFALALYSYFQNTVKGYLVEAVEATIDANTNELKVLLERIETSINLVHSNDIMYTEEQTDMSTFCEMIVSYDPIVSNNDLRMLIDQYDTNLSMFNNYFFSCFGERIEYNNLLFTDSSWPIHVFMPKMDSLHRRNGFSSSLKVEDQEWYIRAKQLKGECYWFIQDAFPERLCMAKALTYKYVNNAGILHEYDLAVLVVTFDIDSLFQHFSFEDFLFEPEIYLTNDTEVIYCTNNNNVILDQYLDSGIDENKKWQTNNNGKDTYVHKIQLPLGLRIVSVVPMQKVRQMASDTVGIIGILGVVTIVVAISITFVLGILLVSPLRRFAQYMEEGNTEDYPYNEDREDELTAIYKGFNHLMKQLKESTNKILIANEKKKKAELYALQAQINPHFVYNTLNSVSCLALLNGQEGIADVLGNLASIMRYNISNPEQMVTVAEEIKILRQYENIQRCCYHDSIHFEYDIAQEAEDIMIPKVVIQPLVENSLIHGKNRNESIGIVKISVYVKCDYLMITVWDNGKDADINRINQHMLGQIDGVKKKDSLGVRNVYERIIGVYGEKAGLFYSKDEEGNTIGYLQIPIIKQDASLKL